MLSYFILYICVAIWIFLDSKKREFNGILYAGATCLFGPLVAPVYLAKRNLKEGEIREGGTAWNILKNFALFWTATIFIFGIAWMIAVFAASGAVLNNSSDAAANAGAAAGAAIGTVFVFGTLLATWFFPMVCALVLGLFLKQASVIETGPTGKACRCIRTGQESTLSASQTGTNKEPSKTKARTASRADKKRLVCNRKEAH